MAITLTPSAQASQPALQNLTGSSGAAEKTDASSQQDRRARSTYATAWFYSYSVLAFSNTSSIPPTM